MADSNPDVDFDQRLSESNAEDTANAVLELSWAFAAWLTTLDKLMAQSAEHPDFGVAATNMMPLVFSDKYQSIWDFDRNGEYQDTGWKGDPYETRQRVPWGGIANIAASPRFFTAELPDGQEVNAVTFAIEGPTGLTYMPESEIMVMLTMVNYPGDLKTGDVKVVAMTNSRTEEFPFGQGAVQTIDGALGSSK